MQNSFGFSSFFYRQHSSLAGDKTNFNSYDGKLKKGDTETMKPKKTLEKLEQTEAAWETHAPDKTFFNTTLAQFKAKVKASRDIRDVIANLEQQMTAAITERDNVDAGNIKLEQNVAKAIAGDPEFGDDSALYEGTGRVRKSERKSGLTRKKKNGEEPQ